jgi:hypothetical protein
MKRAQLLQEFVVTPTWHREDELQRAAAGQLDALQGVEIVETEQTAVGDHDQALYLRKALEQRG